MAQDTQHTDTQPRRELERLQLAMLMGRICALDYDVPEDLFEVWPAEGAACEGLEQLSGSLAELLKRVHAEDRGGVERAIQQALAEGGPLSSASRTI
jgi:hypothetical protein